MPILRETPPESFRDGVVRSVTSVDAHPLAYTAIQTPEGTVMLKLLKNLERFVANATDGEVGRIANFFSESARQEFRPRCR